MQLNSNIEIEQHEKFLNRLQNFSILIIDGGEKFMIKDQNNQWIMRWYYDVNNKIVFHIHYSLSDIIEINFLKKLTIKYFNIIFSSFIEDTKRSIDSLYIWYDICGMVDSSNKEEYEKNHLWG